MSDHRSRADAYPWAVLLAFVALSAWANSLHAPDDWTLRFVAGLVPVSAALCWHLLVRPGLADGWRRVLSRSTALAVFGFTMWASFGSLTAIGVRAGLNPPAALAVTLDGLAVVAAFSVWAHAPQVGVASEDTPAIAVLRADVDSIRRSMLALVVPEVGRAELDQVRSNILTEVQAKLDQLAKAMTESKGSGKPRASARPRSDDWLEAVRLMRASGVLKQTAYNRASAAERDGRLAELIVQLRKPRAVGAGA